MSSWKKFTISATLGAGASFAFTPTYFFFVLFFSFPGLLFLISRSKSWKETFLVGWSFGFGFFLIGMYWICYALMVDSDLFGWLVPFAVTLIPSVVAIYIGITSIIIHPVRHHPLILTICFVCAWVLIEILRTHLFTGFPWLTLGYSLGNWINMIQSASLFGVFGLSLLVLITSTLPFVLIIHRNKIHRSFYLAFCIFILSSNFVYGAWRLDNGKTALLPTKVRIVQPNIKQDIKWDKNYKYANLQKLLSLSKSEENPTYIIWPESALTYSIEDPKVQSLLASVISPNSYLLTGAVSYKLQTNKLYVSLLAVNSKGEISAIYDKKHLVPFGEYTPFKEYIPGIHKITHGLMDYSKGENEHDIISKIKGPSFRPLICYEAFFPTETLNKDTKPDFLLNIINDAWYKDSSGPYQHLEMARFRAIEAGVPLLRSANTGISAIIDPYGRIIKKIPLNKQNVIEYSLPDKIFTMTLYNLYGNNIVSFLLLLILVVFLTQRKLRGADYENFPK